MISKMQVLPYDAPSPGAAARPISGTTKISDVSLIRDIARGEKWAMHAFYTRHNLRVFRFALRILHDDALAEDTVSEVFLNVWRKAGNFSGRSQVSTWLLAITRHKAHEIARRRLAEPLNDEEYEAVADTSDDPETSMCKKQNGSILFACLSKLSAHHREIIDLVYYHEKSIDEAAAILCVPRNTVKTRMFYARQRLAHLLSGKVVLTART